jgi:KDO2-lipid IV(A) lauroyltransferase
MGEGMAAASTPVVWPTRARRRLRHELVRLALAAVGRLPLLVAGRLGAAVGWLGFQLARRERARALASLSRAFPLETDAWRRGVAHRAFVHFGAAAGELASVWRQGAGHNASVSWPHEAWAPLAAARAQGKGILFVTAHLGNWEVMARALVAGGYPTSVIGREASDPHTTALIGAFRGQAGVKVIWRGAPGAARQMLRALRSNGVLGLLIDQDTRVQSVWVPFFGQLAKTPRAAADLVLRTGAAPVLGFCVRTGPGAYRVWTEAVPLPAGEGEAAVLELTAGLTARIESAIRAYPEQWVWMHERWKSPPPPR